MHGAGRQPIGEGVHQRLHAAPERCEQAVAGAADTRLLGVGLALPVAQGEDQAAVASLHLQELRHGGLHAEMPWIGGVNAADHGLGHALQGFQAQAAGDEVGEGFVALRSAATRQHKIQGHAKLAGPAESAGGDERPHGARRHEVKPLRNRHEVAVAHDEALPMLGSGADELTTKPEFVAQLDAPGLGGEKAVRPFFDQQAVLVTGADNAAKAVTGL